MAGYNVSSKNFKKILIKNNFVYLRTTGDHSIFKDVETGRLAVIPHKLNPIIAERIIKDFKLNTNIK